MIPYFCPKVCGEKTDFAQYVAVYVESFAIFLFIFVWIWWIRFFFHFKISTTSGNAMLCLWPFLGIWLTKATPSKQWRFTISKKVFCPWSIKANPCFYSESFLFESFLKTFCIFAIFETMFVPEGKKIK